MPGSHAAFVSRAVVFALALVAVWLLLRRPLAARRRPWRRRAALGDPRSPTDPLLRSAGMSDRRRYYLTTAIAYANNAPGLHTVYEVIGADVIARWHRMLGDDTRFLTGTDEHSVNIAQSAEARGPHAARVRRREGRAVPGGRGRAADQPRPVHPHDRPRPLPLGPGDGPPGVRQRRHLPRHLRGLVLPQRGVQGDVRPARDGARDAVPQPPRRRAPVADGAQLVLPPVGLPGAPARALRAAPGLRPARLPAQRDAGLHPRRPRGLLDQPRPASAGGSRSRSPRTARPRSARTGRGTPRRARSTSGTTR